MLVATRILQIALLVLYPLFAHVAVYLQQPKLALIPLLLMIVTYLEPKKIRHYPRSQLGFFFIAFSAIIVSIVYNKTSLLYLQPIIVSLMSLILFAKTLLPGQEPFITLLARVIYHDTQAEVKAYTRRVTEIWCLFFFAMLIETLLLSIYAKPETWSLFCNILNYIFIAILFFGEFIYRQYKFKNNTSLIVLFKQMLKMDIKQLIKQEKTNKLPLIKHLNATTVFAFHKKKMITCFDFLIDVKKASQQLPKTQYIINLCEDRYYFTVLFCAALLKKKITLLPNNTSHLTLSELKKEFTHSFLAKDNTVATYLQKTNLINKKSYSIPCIASTQLAAILYTSGSTGKPQPCKKYWGELVSHCQITAAALGLMKQQEVCIVATVAPQHMYGLEHSVILPMQMGYALCGYKPFFCDDIKQALIKPKHEIVLFSTPLQLKQCLDESACFNPIRLLVSSTASLTQTMALDLEKKFTTSVYEIYGCTEAGCIATRRPTTKDAWTINSDYRLHHENNDCFLIFENQNKIKLLDAIKSIDESHFMLLGRLQDNINIAGNRMSLSDLNIKLNSISGIKDGVFYLPQTENMAVRLIAFVVTETLSTHEIKLALTPMMNPVFLPKKIIKLDTLPRNALGKIDYQAMQTLIASLEGEKPC